MSLGQIQGPVKITAYGGGKKSNCCVDYSTVEKDTGILWIDGKTVYRKVIPVSALPATPGTHGVNAGIGANVVETVVKLQPVLTNGGLHFQQFNQYPANKGFSQVMYIPSLDTVNISHFADVAGYTGHVIIEYTKS